MARMPRRLEIGPGSSPIPGFESLNLHPPADHVADCRRLPFPDGTFAEVYSSHCIEHVEWFEVEATICEWARVVEPGGILEVHTVNAVPLMKAMIEIDETGHTSLKPGKWRCDLHGYDAYKWAAGRIMNYTRKGSGTHWMHRAILTPGYMRGCFEKAGLVDLEPVAEPRGAKKHASINMGLRGRKC